MMPTSTGIFIARFKTKRRKKNLASALGIQRENMHSEILEGKNAIHCFVFYCFFRIINCCLIISKKCMVTTNFFLDFDSSC